MTLRELLERNVLLIRHRTWPFPNDHMQVTPDSVRARLFVHDLAAAVLDVKDVLGQPLKPLEGEVSLALFLDTDGWDPYVPKE